MRRRILILLALFLLLQILLLHLFPGYAAFWHHLTGWY